MNSFMNALWNAKGAEVSGSYNGEEFLGIVTDVRTKAGIQLEVSVRTNDGTLLISGDTLYRGFDAVYSNLHVYF